MEINKREVNPIYYSLLSILTLINTLMLLRVLIYFPYHRLITHETLWSFYLSTIYLYSIFISDTNLFLFKSTSLEKFNSFIRNYFSVIAYPYCYTITIEFWAILFTGMTFGINPFLEEKTVSKEVLYDALYLHLAICLIIVVDLFCTKRKLVENKILLFIINFIFFCYCIVVLWTNYVLLRPAYPFMKDAGIIVMLIAFIISLFFVNLCYYLHLYLVKIINKDDEKIQKKII
jgi:hypothetical protein